MDTIQPHLTHLFMEVGDLDRARDFWVDVIGLQPLDDRGPYIAVGGNGGFAIGIEQNADGPVSAEGSEITVRVDDVDVLVTRLGSIGVEIEDEPADQPWQARHAWIRDPDGRRTSIYATDTPTATVTSVGKP